jgi:hypothetical protein
MKHYPLAFVMADDATVFRRLGRPDNEGTHRAIRSQTGDKREMVTDIAQHRSGRFGDLGAKPMDGEDSPRSSVER